MADELAKRESRRVTFLGILLICLGVVFMRSGRLGATFLIAGAALVIFALIRKKR